MAAHAPYIMPDGRSLGQYLAQEREREQLRRRKAELRGKDLQFAQLIRQRGAATNELELAELKAMESAGVRRRRRWLNDKTLRDLAGPLSAADMEAQFKPAPFGVSAPSPLAQALAPGNAALWDNFRNIDPEKEARVLQKWAAHQRESAPPRQRPRLSQAGLALQRWAAVNRRARAALKRANPASVLQLELQILDFFEQAAPGATLVLPLEDGFARLLVHGLADFHGLLSASRTDDTGAACVAVYRRAKPLSSGDGGGSRDTSAGAAPRPGSAPRSTSLGSGVGGGGGGAGSTGPSPARGSVVGRSPARGASGGSGPQATGAAAASPGLGGTGGAGSLPSPSPSPGRRGGAAGREAVSGASPQPAQPAGRSVSSSRGGGGGGGGGGEGGEREVVDHEVTCTDVLLAMAEVGQLGLNEEVLRRYVHVHLHGTMAAEGQQQQRGQVRGVRAADAACGSW